MKNYLILALSTLTLSVIASPTLARDVTGFNYNYHSKTMEITPFNLVSRGYQGYFANHGVEGNAGFTRAIRTGKVTAKDLVKLGINQGRLAPSTINDQAYLNDVKYHLRNFDHD